MSLLFTFFFVKHLVHHVHFDRFVVLVFIAAAVTIVIALMHPAARLSEKRDEMRARDVRDILAALVEYRAAHEGELPAGVDADSTTFQLLGQQAFGCEQRCEGALTIDACLNLSAAISETGLSRLPMDPVGGSDFMTGYAVNVRENGRLDVVACESESGEQIEVRQ